MLDQALYEMGEVNGRKIKNANAFKNPEIRDATRLLLFDGLVSECKTHWEESRTFGVQKDAGIFALSQIPSNAAMADGNNDQIPSSVTIPLEGLTLKAGQYIELTDTTPVLVTDYHVTINVPCKNGDNNDPESDIAVVAGVAPDLVPVELEFISELSDPEDNCLYNADVPENEDDDVTDIVILNPGDETIKFRSGNFATISITEVSDD